MHLARFPRLRLAHLPTPLEPLPRLGEALGLDLWVKRDDQTGLAGGGNKTRKLEFLVGEALAQDADTLVTQGAVQSNHVRQTAAAAAACGLRCELILEQRTGSTAPDYLGNGNVLLDRLLGASVRFVDGGTDMTAELAATAEQVRARGGRPYVIPGGGSNPVGALGYVDCARELLVQADELDLQIDRIVVASGSAGTHAGLLAGLAVMGVDAPVLGIGVRAPQAKQTVMVRELAAETCARLGQAGRWDDARVVCDCDHVGGGYGVLDAATVEALTMAARLEGLILDPVYTGKAMKGLIARARAGDFLEGETVVFVHTGGAQGLFGYQSELEGRL